MLHVYLVTLAAIALGQMLPGPNLVAVAGAALGQGRRLALFLTLGVATASFVWVTLAALGLGALLAVFPSFLTAMKLIGGGYLCFLAMKAARGAMTGAGATFRASSGEWTVAQAWRRGVLVNLTNPKSALLWGAIATFLYGSGLSSLQVAAFAPLSFSSAMLIYGTYSLLFSSGIAKRVYGRFSSWIEALFGLAFGAFGAKLVVDGCREIAR